MLFDALLISLISCSIRQQDFEAHQLYSQVPQFYDFLQNRVLVSFKPKFEEVTETNPEFELILSKKNTYDVVSFCVPYSNCLGSA